MADRSVRVRLEAQIAGYSAAMSKASSDTRQFQSTVMASARANEQAFNTVGLAAGAMGAATALGMKAAAGAAIDFESSFAGVEKTVNASRAQLNQLSAGFRQMAKEIPVNVNELNRIGEAAGQLGIETDNILGFTRTMADLAVTTDLSSDQAASALARLANITQMPQDEFDKLGSTIVGLGNAGASTESEIVEMGLRIAGAGAQIGMTEPQILGFANALSSVGIEAEAGGSSISKVMIDMASEVATGGDKLQTFAAVAGMSSRQFSQAFEQDASGAVLTFVEGLGAMSDSGQNVFGVLDQLGLSEIRVRDALLRASGAGDLFRESLELGSRAWEENNALNEEAAKRYATTEARLQVAQNQINDFGIAMGDVLLPAVGAVADKVGDFADTLGSLPTPAKTAAVALGGTASAVGLTAGAALLALPKIAHFSDAMETLNLKGGRLDRTMGKVGKAFGFAAAAYVAAEAVDLLGDKISNLITGGPADINALSGALVDFAVEARVTGEMARTFGDDLGEFGGNLKRLVDPGAIDRMHDLSGALANVAPGIGHLVTRSYSLDAATENFEALDKALAGLVAAGHGDVAARVMSQLEQQAKAAGVTVKQLNSVLPDYARATAAVAAEEKAAAASAEVQGDAMEGAGKSAAGAANEYRDLAGEIEDTRTAGEKLLDTFTLLNGGTIDVQRAAINYEASLDDLRKAFKGNNDTLDLSTKKGREHRAAIIDTVEALQDHIAAIADDGGTVKQQRRAYRDHIKDFRETAEAAGLSEGQIRKLIRQYKLTPDKVFTDVQARGADSARADVEALGAAFDGLGAKIAKINGEVRVNVSGGWSKGIARNAGGGVPGPRTGRDTVPAMLTPGEFVQSQPAVDYYGAGFMAALNERRIPRRALGLNAGGIVNITAASAASAEAMPQLSSLVALGRYLQGQGFRVSGHAAFGGTPLSGHAPNSKHYRNRAIDANYGPPGASAVERAAIAGHLPAVVAMAGGRLTENLHPFNDPSHYDHWHLAMNEGGLVPGFASGGMVTPGLTRGIGNVNDLIDELLDAINDRKGPTRRQERRLETLRGRRSALRERRETARDYLYSQLTRGQKIRYARARLDKAKFGTDAWYDWRTELDDLLEERRSDRSDARSARAERTQTRNERVAEQAREIRQNRFQWRYDHWPVSRKKQYAQGLLSRLESKGHRFSEMWMKWARELEMLEGEGTTAAAPETAAPSPLSGIEGWRGIIDRTGVGGVRVVPAGSQMTQVQVFLDGKQIGSTTSVALAVGGTLRVDAVASS